MIRYLFILAFAVNSIGTAFAVTRASDGTSADVAAKVALCTDDFADIVTLPAGTFSWKVGVDITKSITLQGAGIGQTIIIDDNTNASAEELLDWGTVAGKRYRMTGIEFRRALRNVTGSAATNVVTCVNHNFSVGDKFYFTVVATRDPDDVQLAGGAGIAYVDYFVKTTPTADTFTFSSTNGGAEFDFTTDITAGMVGRSRSFDSSMIWVGGFSEEFVIDNCRFYNIENTYVQWRNITGVVYDCEFVQNAGEEVSSRPFKFDHRAVNTGGVDDSYGDSSWENAINWTGDRKALVVEDCTFDRFGTSASTLYGMTDSINGGGRLVFRYNTVNKSRISNHGTESSQRFRGGRLMEVYGNVFNNAYDTPSTIDAAVDMRSGTGISWGNDFTGSYNSQFKTNSYRLSSAYGPWGLADGTKAWDTADVTDTYGTAGDGIFFAGTQDDQGADFLYPSETVGITVSQSGSTLTASAPIFTAGMVGKQVQWIFPQSLSYPRRTITSFTSSTSVQIDGNATRPSWRFCVLPFSTLYDAGAGWTDDQWVGFTLRQTVPYTGTSGDANTVTVTGAGWETNQWSGWSFTKGSNPLTGDKGEVASNTSDTITLSGSPFFKPNMTGGGAFQLSNASLIEGNTSDTIQVNNTAEGVTYVFQLVGTYEIRKLSKVLDDSGLGVTTDIVGVPPNHQNLNQGLDPCYFFSNRLRATPLTVGWPGTMVIGNTTSIIEERNYYKENPSFTGATGVGVGTLASRPSSGLTAGVGYWATDQGEWNSTNGATPDGQLYVATSPTTWALHYVPYTYPHPQRGDAVPPVTPDPDSRHSKRIRGKRKLLKF